MHQMAGLRRCLWVLGALALRVCSACPMDVADTILILAKDDWSANQASSGLKGYGIPFETVLVPQNGFTLPALNASTEKGNYGGIITVSELSYEYPTGWASAISTAQWQQMYDYQLAFGVRMVRIDAFPQPDFGTTLAIQWEGCCGAGVEQKIKFTDDTHFATANIKLNQGVSTMGIWHIPATITDSSTTIQIAAFEPSGSFTTDTTAAVINNFNGRQQMVWFMGWVTDWAQGPNYLQHASIHFLTRGLFAGARKIYLNTQVDDMHLNSSIYFPAGSIFRVRPADLDAHVAWQADLNTRLPAGSEYFIEVAHNGNGDIIESCQADAQGVCTPEYAVFTDDPDTTPLEFVKPLGTGRDLWDPQFTTYAWSQQCAALDPLAAWFTVPAHRDSFAHLSHTFTHLELNNATYADAVREVVFNRAWMAQMGIDGAARYSTNGLVPPAITGMHNGDVIKAWMDNNILHVVGDNTRPVLRNSNSEYWPRISTVAADGYAGLVVIPRWATTIYYNCDTAECTTQEWIATSAGSGDFTNLLNDARNVNSKYLLSLHADPYMFHQANMRNIDAPTITIGSQTGKMSLLQSWVETITQEMTRLTNWPIKSLKHDDIAKLFVDRMTRDQCKPKLLYHLSENKTITAVTLSTEGNSCSVPVPVTFPGSATTTAGGTTVDQVGSEPPIVWTPMNGQSIFFTLNTPIPL